MNNQKIKIGAVVLCTLAIGFFAGMEYKAYQIRSTIEDALSGVFDDTNTSPEVTEEKIPEPKEEEKPVNDLYTKVDFAVVEKKFVEGDFSDANTFTFQFVNKTEKDIEGVKGVIHFNDIFGDQIKRVNISYDEGIKAGETKLYRASVDYNQFMEEDITLRQTELEKLKYEWEVQTIIYTDGTQDKF
jgi:hypothetical protein